MSAAPGLFDVGAQPERTLLAWRRTCLSVAVTVLLMTRFAVERIGIIAVVLCLIAMAGTLWSYAAAGAGYRRANRALREARPLPASGVAVAVLSLAALSLGAIVVAFVLL